MIPRLREVPDGTAARVECYSGYRYAQRPVAILWGEERLEVSEVEAEWHTTEGKRFWVRTVDGSRFDLHYSAVEDDWLIQQM
jgi:surfactin synthase thioesterase subunit